MRVWMALVKRELGAFFLSLIGYVIISLVLVLIGLSFLTILSVFNGVAMDAPITETFYSTPFFWLIILLASPVITMRSFAQEKHSETYEALMTTPVGDWQVVTAKFLGAWLFYALMWLPLLACLLSVRRYLDDPALLDAGIIASTLIGILLVGSVFIAMGCFASSLTRSQIIAAMISMTMGVVLFLLSYLTLQWPDQTGWKADLLAQISMIEHMQDFVRGIIDSRHVVFYLGLTVWFLYLTWRVVESRKWKGT